MFVIKRSLWSLPLISLLGTPVKCIKGKRQRQNNNVDWGDGQTDDGVLVPPGALNLDVRMNEWEGPRAYSFWERTSNAMTVALWVSK
jgi:hypothetical protein